MLSTVRWCSAQGRATVVDEVELNVAPSTELLPVALFVGVGHVLRRSRIGR